MDVYEQLSLFSNNNDQQRSKMDYQERPLQVMRLYYGGITNTCSDELFDGYDNLYAITFSYGLSFINKIIRNFNTAEIIIGNTFAVKYDLKEIISFQERTLREIRRHSELIRRVKAKEVEFWVSKNLIAHEKIYILTKKNGESRIIIGSVNFGEKAFSGDQREFIGYIDNDPEALDIFLAEFELVKGEATNRVVEEALYVSDNSEKEFENIPILREARTKESGAIFEESQVNLDAVEFAVDVRQLSSKYKNIIPKLDKKGTKVFLRPDKLHALIKEYKKHLQNQKEKNKIYPKFIIDYDRCSANLNGRAFDMTPEKAMIKNDIQRLLDYFDGFNDFINYTIYAKKLYFQALNYMFLSPFIAHLRYTAHKYGFSEEYFPYYAILNGPKSAGKTQFVETVQVLMFGKSLGKVSPEIFTRTRILGMLQEAQNVPIHINDIGKDRFNKGCGEIIKCDDFLFEKNIYNHPVFIMTSNDIDVIKKDMAKRIFFAHIEMTQDNVAAASKKKVLVETRKHMSRSFYTEYLRQMIPLVSRMLEDMASYDIGGIPENGEAWQPDIFHLSSKIICYIFEENNIEIPDYISEVTYEDYFGKTAIVENIREKMIFEWEHNRHAFRILRKTNCLEYNAGEHAYEATRIVDALPEDICAKKSGTKVIMNLEKAEAFTGIQFQKHFWKK